MTTTCERLKGKTVLVTGSTKGFGAAMARRFAAEGANVAITGRSQAEGAAVEQQIRDAGGAAVFLPADLTQEGSVRQLIAGVVGSFGRLDALVNNAMAMDQVGPSERPIADMDTAGLDRILRVGIYGLFWATKYAIPELLKFGGGSIVNISSLAAVAGVPSLPAYSMCKGAMGALTRQVATDYGPQGIRINTMICGIVLAEGLAAAIAAHPVAGGKMAEAQLTRYGTLDDIAGLATYLVSDESGFVNGAELRIDGGWTSTARFPNLVDLVLADLAPQS
jgi:3-oxoacyl-[acyl-carrier protein] reductase